MDRLDDIDLLALVSWLPSLINWYKMAHLLDVGHIVSVSSPSPKARRFKVHIQHGNAVSCYYSDSDLLLNRTD